MGSKRVYFGIVIIILIGLFLNINTVLGEKSAFSPNATEPPLLQASFNATKDAYVTGAGGNYENNLGSSSDLVIGSSGTSPFIYGYHTLVDFDLSTLPNDAEIVSATLRLNTYFNLTSSPASTDAAINVYSEAVDAAWGEYTVTWANKPTSTSYGDPANSVDGFSVSEDWDVTNIVSAWKSGAQEQHGIVLFSTSDSPISTHPFYSREGGTDPQLTISYRTSIPTNTPTPTTTSTPTETPPVSGTCPGTVKVYADSDTYTDSGAPTAINGSTGGIALSKSPDARYSFLHFPLEQVVPENQYIYSASLYLQERNQPSGEAAAPWDVFVYTPIAGFNESTTNWTNQPAPFLGLMKKLTTTSSPGQVVIHDLEYFVNLWHNQVYPNDGLGIWLQDENTLLRYHSREAGNTSNRPYLEINCGSTAPTATPTPTNTPVPTATPTAIPKTVNYMAKDLEVTQGVQRITNTVRLVEGKRTFIRFYVDVYDTAHVDGKIYSIDAELRLYRGNSLVETLLPVNSPNGYLDLPYGWENPFLDEDSLKMVSDNTFIFEVPSNLTSGTLRLVGDVNLDWKYPETNWIDNEVEVTVDFEPVPQFGLRVYRVKWQDSDDTYYTTSMQNITDSLHFARQALPVPDIWAQSYMINYYEQYGKVEPKESILNVFLHQKWWWDYSNNGTLFQDFPIVRYYALIDKNNSQSGGLAAGIPSIVASGWTGRTSTFTHELGHTFGRHHATFCGAESGCVNVNVWGWKPCPDGYVDYPYNDGKIGPYQFSVQGFVYGDNNQFEIRSSNWADLMTYCSNRWISDFTYHGIMNYLQPNLLSGQELLQGDLTSAPSDNLMISGTIDLDTGQLDLAPLFVVPNSSALGTYESGDFAIILKNSDGIELARYWFNPPVAIGERTCSLADGSHVENNISFLEMVPYHPQTARVEIEGPNGSGVVASVESGMSTPSITVTSPNGGEVINGDTVAVNWSASDPDGDELTFNVQFSPDNGASWDIVALNIKGTQAVIDRDNFQASNQALVRVYASDGIHTASDTSNSTFTIVNSPPTVEITQPASYSIVVLGQTVPFSAVGFDLDLGTLSGDSLTWFSDIDGELGKGAQFSTAGLSPGLHTITVLVNDAEGGVAADSVQVYIYSDPSQVPPQPDLLKAAPAEILINAEEASSTPFIQVYNYNNHDPITWSASSSESWLELSTTSGTTRDLIYLTAHSSGLPGGIHTSTVTITNLDDPSQSQEVKVNLVINSHGTRSGTIFIPIVVKQP